MDNTSEGISLAGYRTSSVVFKFYFIHASVQEPRSTKIQKCKQKNLKTGSNILIATNAWAESIGTVIVDPKPRPVVVYFKISTQSHSSTGSLRGTRLNELSTFPQQSTGLVWILKGWSCTRVLFMPSCKMIQVSPSTIMQIFFIVQAKGTLRGWA